LESASIAVHVQQSPAPSSICSIVTFFCFAYRTPSWAARGSAKVIDGYYEQYEQYGQSEEEFPEQTLITRLFATTLDAIRALFPKIAQATRWGNRADFYSLFVSLGNLFRQHTLPSRNVRLLARKLAKFATDVDVSLEDPSDTGVDEPSYKYARAIEKGSNDKARRMDRHEALIGIIQPLLRKKI
jgi:hypothetical protein